MADDSDDADEERMNSALPQQKSGGLFSGFGFGGGKKAKAKVSKKSDAYSAQLYQASKMSKGSYMKK